MNPNEKGINWESLDSYIDEKVLQGHSWFFGIGINRYKELPNLNNAVKDIKDFSTLLCRRYDLNPEHVMTLFDEDATRESIIETFDRLVDELKEEDKLIIYFSGHGHYNKKTNFGYWIPNDAKKDKTANYIPNVTIQDYIKVIPARHILLISDSCFSGALFVRGLNRSSVVMEELETIPSRWAICSGRHDEEVYDGVPGTNSPFAMSILDTLKRNQNSAFNVAKLAEQVVEQTRSNYRQLPEGSPLFGVGHKGGQYVFRLKPGVSQQYDTTPTPPVSFDKNNPVEKELIPEQNRNNRTRITWRVGMKWMAALLSVMMLGWLLHYNFSGSNHEKVAIGDIVIFQDSLSRKYGYKSINGTIFIPAKYDSAFVFKEGLAPVKKFKWGFIDSLGNEVIACNYDMVTAFDKGSARVTQAGDEFFIDLKGHRTGNYDGTEVKDTTSVPKEKEGKTERDDESGQKPERSTNIQGEEDGTVVGNLPPKNNSGNSVKPEEEVALPEVVSVPLGNKTYTGRNINGRYWLTENLNYPEDISWCYNNQENNCRKFGRLYNWANAKEACKQLGAGWRLPSQSEWDTLKEVYGNSSTQAYNKMIQGGSSQLELVFGGYRNSEGEFKAADTEGIYWSDQIDNDPNKAIGFVFSKTNRKMSSPPFFNNYGLSCRCIKDR